MSNRMKRIGGTLGAVMVSASLVAPAAFANHNNVSPPGNPGQCQETGGYAADEKRPASAKADDDAGQNGQNRAAVRSPAIGSGACPAE